uniref:uncharacterized protein LOC117611206 n=1 Tax=Osmia lignaria TaxID=473952 RepID=UPI0014791C08|nr:uncharacterized protein LOC117611206 [Osmia lignaria]
MNSVDLTGDEEEVEDIPSTRKDSWTGGSKANEGTADVTIEEKMDFCLEAMSKMIETIIDHNSAIKSFMQRSRYVAPKMRDTYITMGSYLERFAESIDQMRCFHTEYRKTKRNREREMQPLTYTGTPIPEMAPDDDGPAKNKRQNYKCAATQTVEAIEEQFPPLPTVRNKRKEITPPTQNAEKKSRRQTIYGAPRREKPDSESIVMDTPRSDTMTDSEWETVQPRKRKNDVEKQRIGTNENYLQAALNKNNANKLEKRKTPSKRPVRPQAIAVRFGKEASFAEVLKKVKMVAGSAPEGVKSVKQSRAGNLLIEFAPDADLDGFRKIIDGKLGPDIEVARLQQRMDVELKGIDPSADREEVLEAVKRELGDVTDVQLKILRADPRLNKVAIMEGPAVKMARLVRKAKIKIGWTVAFVKEVPRLLRCYRCHDFVVIRTTRCVSVQLSLDADFALRTTSLKQT